MPLEYALQFRGKNPDPGPWKLPRSFSVRPSQPLGISDLPVQRLRRSKHRPYLFNVMVVGESGLGKTTFMNSLFNTDLVEQIPVKNLSSPPTKRIHPTTYELEEDGVTLHLTVVDTPGFGDALNREQNFQPILDYIEKQYDEYLEQEQSREMRRNIRDTRIHSLVYFLPPTGVDRLKDMDIEFLQRLCTKVNIIPVISKADTLTPDEMTAYKRAILRDFDKYDIRAYPSAAANTADEHTQRDLAVSVCAPEVSAHTRIQYEKYMPFSVLASDQLIEKPDGTKVRGRRYRWGTVEVENPEHSDFPALRSMMIQSHLQDLIETTHSVHYANYRSGRIRQKGRPESILACDEYYDSRVDNAKRGLAEEMQRREDEMRQMFVGKVREKESSLRQREEKLNDKRKEMMQELEGLRRQVEAEEAAVAELSAQRKRNPR